MRETLQWLDDATSHHPDVVTLQGADEIYENWSDVEKFAVPRTLFSEDDVLDEPISSLANSPELQMSRLNLDDTHHKTPLSSAASETSRPYSPSSMRSQRSSLSAMSPPTSPVKAVESPARPVSAQLELSSSSGAVVAPHYQPLFNYILWRIHQEVDPVVALESFIFLCNDPGKANFAKGFDIKTKRLEHMRDAIGREDRDVKNRQMVASRENHNVGHVTGAPAPQPAQAEKLVQPKTPPRAPAAMLMKQDVQQPTSPNLIDPDAFDRRAPIVPVAGPMQSTTRGYFGQGDLAGLRGRAAPRGRSRGNFRGEPRGRGDYGPPQRGGFPSNDRMASAPMNGQIDPNSFSRPRGRGQTRGARKLWVPL